ncbi:MAG: sulfur oxidation c-type cytochrome SoxA [Methylococcales bacterium]|jgi:sulfur-oxidizing protein SoxA|nr:sulfur oxidation c-type cytochrome SoxA [Methylococcales bacterium]
MKSPWLIIFTLLTTSLAFNTSYAETQDEDLKKYRTFFLNKFSNLKLEDFKDGVYALDSIARESWIEIEEFPPYEIYIEEGEELFNKAFSNGKTFADCFPNKGIGIADQYPYWNNERKEVITLPLAVNECHEKNNGKKLKYGKGKLASIVSYMVSTTRGKKTNIIIPSDSDAVAAYEKGKQFFFARRGQLNFSCAHCHMAYSGSHIRTEVLGPTLGQTTGFPVYRSKWGNMGTLHRRFSGCNKQVRAKPFKLQSEEYRNLEYFITHMSNGITINGPSARR